VDGVAGAAHREIQPRLPEQRIGVAPQLTWHDADRAAREAQGLLLVTALACERR